MVLAPDLAGRSVCYLETIGRSSGQPREIEIWFAADPFRDRIYLLSGGGDSAHWVRNIRSTATVRVRIGDRWFRGHAMEMTGHQDEIAARRLVGSKYGYWQAGTELAGWARDSLPIAIDLAAAVPALTLGPRITTTRADTGLPPFARGLVRATRPDTRDARLERSEARTARLAVGCPLPGRPSWRRGICASW